MKEKDFPEKPKKRFSARGCAMYLLLIPWAIVVSDIVHATRATCEEDGISVSSEGLFNSGYAIMLLSPLIGIVIGRWARKRVRWQILSILIGIFAGLASMLLGSALIQLGVS